MWKPFGDVAYKCNLKGQKIPQVLSFFHQYEKRKDTGISRYSSVVFKVLNTFTFLRLTCFLNRRIKAFSTLLWL